MKIISKILLALLIFAFVQTANAQITSSRGNSFCEGNSTTLTLSGASGNNYVWKVQYGTGSIDTLFVGGGSVTVMPHFIGDVKYFVYNAGALSMLAMITINVRECCSSSSEFAISKICTPLNIDGLDNEFEWGVSDWVLINRLAGGSGISATPAGKWKMLYDDENIYLYVVVYDNNQPINSYWTIPPQPAHPGYDGDGVEFFIDAGTICNGNYPLQIGFMYPATGTTPGRYNNTNCPSASFVGYTAVVRPWNGADWALEVKIPAAINGVNLNGNSIRTEVGINQSNATGTTRTAQYHSWTNSFLVYSNKTLLSPVSLVDCASTRASREEVCEGVEIQLSSSIKSATTGVDVTTAYTWQICYNNCDDNSVGSTSWTNVAANTAGNINITPNFNGGTEVYYRAVYNGEIAACPIKISLSNDFIPINRTATICAGQTYSFYGQTLTASGNFNANVSSTTGGCDSIINLTLSVLPRIPDYRTATICHNELPYNFYGQILTTSGNYNANVSSTTGGCDSIITLNLTVKPLPTVRVVESDVCLNDAVHLEFTGTPPFTLDYTFNGTRQTVNVSGMNTTLTATQTGENVLIVNSLGSGNGCSMGVINEYTVIVHPTYSQTENITIYTSELPYSWRDTVFDVGTIDATFIFNRTSAFGCDSIVTLNLTVKDQPVDTIYSTIYAAICEGQTYLFNGKDYSVSGIYADTLPTADGYEVITLVLNVFPNLIEQKWNDVLALLNKTAGNYQYDAVAFKWYKSGKLMEGETKSYIYHPSGLDFTACYSATLTLTDGSELNTCELCPAFRDGCEVTVVQPNSAPMNVKSCRSGVLRIYSVTGILIGQQNFEQNITVINIPLPNGMYIFEFILQDDTRQSRVVVISK